MTTQKEFKEILRNIIDNDKQFEHIKSLPEQTKTAVIYLFEKGETDTRRASEVRKQLRNLRKDGLFDFTENADE